MKILRTNQNDGDIKHRIEASILFCFIIFINRMESRDDLCLKQRTTDLNSRLNSLSFSKFM